MKRMITVLLLGGMLVAACSSDPTDGAAELPKVSDGLPLAGDDATFPTGMGPGITVEEALSSVTDQPILVNGYVFVYADGSVVIADMIAESFPPQPAGDMITVEGLDVSQIPLFEGPADAEVEITAWTENPAQILVEIADGVFVGTPVASA